MSVSACAPGYIAYDYRATGEVLCRNAKGMVFFLRTELPSNRPVAPATQARTWQPVEAMREVEVRRHAEPQPIAEATRTVAQAAAPSFAAVEALHEVEVRRAAEPQPAGRGTGPLPGVPAPGAAPARGWFGRLLKK